MKKIILALSLLMLSLFVVSCGSPQTESDTGNQIINQQSSDGSPNLIGNDLSSGLDNNNIDNMQDPTLDPNSLG